RSLRQFEDLLAEVGHLPRGVRLIEGDGVSQSLACHRNGARREVVLQVDQTPCWQLNQGFHAGGRFATSKGYTSARVDGPQEFCTESKILVRRSEATNGAPPAGSFD